ncbi:uncharacterized protein TRIADDRAFT_60121 [Trichoplax adhaerens]|uniref:G-protein coupled receptors family 2 profile 2 domain-containing protein n=1 Tax=Trichoplax adhaerens TaxID=10228 RepID=B3S7C9_TRIAD|nr:predicted protein [Trichoplax adhaerens]EDV21267.1 predicted protein [Trichoplax adhaerens]|eukprot:XP_002116234.1 predicted protein [Trichoplax adhaerens]
MIIISRDACESGWTKIDKYCFKRFGSVKDFDDARTACQAFPSGDLVVDNSNVIHNGLEDLLTLYTCHWIGLKDTVGNNQLDSYHWLATGQNVTTGSAFWSLTCPSSLAKGCVYISKITDIVQATWCDYGCDYDCVYICQKPIDASHVTYPITTAISTSSASRNVSTSQLISSSMIFTLTSNNINSATTASSRLNLYPSPTSQSDIGTSQINRPLLSTIPSSNTSTFLSTTANELELLSSTTSNANTGSTLYEDHFVMSLANSSGIITSKTSDLPLLASTTAYTNIISSTLEDPLASSISSLTFTIDVTSDIASISTIISNRETFTVQSASTSTVISDQELSNVQSTSTSTVLGDQDIFNLQSVSTSSVINDQGLSNIQSASTITVIDNQQAFDVQSPSTSAVISDQELSNVQSTSTSTALSDQETFNIESASTSTVLEDQELSNVQSASTIAVIDDQESFNVQSALKSIGLSELEILNIQSSSTTFRAGSSPTILISGVTNYSPSTASIDYKSQVSSSVYQNPLIMLVSDDILDISTSVWDVEDVHNQRLSSNLLVHTNSSVFFATSPTTGDKFSLAIVITGSDLNSSTHADLLMSSVCGYKMASDDCRYLTSSGLSSNVSADLLHHLDTLSLAAMQPSEYSRKSPSVIEIAASMAVNQPAPPNNANYFPDLIKANKTVNNSDNMINALSLILKNTTDDFTVTSIRINKIKATNDQFIANITTGTDKNLEFVLKQIEQYDADLAKEVNQRNITTQVTISTLQSELIIQTISASDIRSAINMALSLSNKSVAEMRIPKSVLQLSGQGEAVTVVVRSLNVEGNWAQNDTKKITSRFIISSILSCSMYPRQDKNFTEPVHFYLKILHKQPIPPYQCAYWEKTGWLKYGIKLLDHNSTTVHCTTNHFTSFAVLMRSSKAITGPHDLYLRYITYIGYSISLFALLIMIMILISNKSSLAWMMIEAIVLMQRISSLRKNMNPKVLRVYFISGWALPAVIVSVSASTGISAYGNSEYCWIESTSYQMWLFVGPVILVVSCNFTIAAAAIRSLFSIKAMVRKSEIQKFKAGIKAVTSLAFLFGLSWIFGILLYSTNDIVFAYLFTILNCPQGLLIFYFHCFRDRNVRDYIRAKFKFGSMIFPSYTVGEANKDVRGKNMHLNEHGIVAKFPVSAENMSRRCKRIERYSTSLNKMPAELREGSANSVSTLASACDHPTLSSTGNQRNEVVSHH